MKVRVKVAYEQYGKEQLLSMLEDRDCLIQELQAKLRAAQKAVNTGTEGCEICNKPAKWEAVFGHEHKFGFPYLFARKQVFEDGKVKAAYCPLCGRKLKEG